MNDGNLIDKKIRGVLVDMDGTLFDTELSSVFAWAVAGRELGVTLDRDFMIDIIGLPPATSERMYYERYGTKVDYEKLRTRKLRIMEDIVLKCGPEFKAGAREFVDYISSAGYKCALVTSTDRNRAVFNLKAAGMYEKFDEVITCEMIKRGKPAPDPFVLAAGRLGLTPFDCVAVEDSENGIISASESGAVTILVPDLILNDKMTALADYRAEDLFGVIEILKRKNCR